jgi:methylated-DNA-protein-cysteine methyltransferase-like protein
MMTFFDRVYAVVRRIPSGRVASYGQVAALCEHPHAARTVGWALNGMPHALADPAHPDAIPWWRVIAKTGHISITGRDDAAGRQRQLMEAEGIAFTADGRVDLQRFRWQPVIADWPLPPAHE